jgi:predicted secreted protein
MSWTAALAIYFIMWFLCLFLVLPFFARYGEKDAPPPVAGQADSAPPVFPVWRVIGIVSLVTAVVFGGYYANYVMGWITVDDINPISAPPRG